MARKIYELLHIQLPGSQEHPHCLSGYSKDVLWDPYLLEQIQGNTSKGSAAWGMDETKIS